MGLQRRKEWKDFQEFEKREIESTIAVLTNKQSKRSWRRKSFLDWKIAPKPTTCSQSCFSWKK